MKNLIKSVLALALTTVSVSTFAQTDVTSKYLVNAGFDDSQSFVTGNVRTYAKDVQTGEFGQMQPVTGWTLGVENGDARAGAAFACGATYFIGGLGCNVPSTNSEGTSEGGVLGALGVWTGTVQYVQNVTLAPGVYTITVPTYNSSGTSQAFAKNLVGFIDDKGNEYLSSVAKIELGKWTNQTVSFTIGKETSGQISLGWASTNKGNGDQQHIFYDCVKIEYQTFVEAAKKTPVTFSVMNPEFTFDTSGWKTYYASKAPSNVKLANNKQGDFTGNFFENWDQNPFEGSVYQIIPNMPAGKYQLKIAAFGNSVVENGLYVYLNDSQTKITSTEPQFYTVDYTLNSDGDLDFGIRNKKVVNWMGIDNVSLTLLGLKPLSLGDPALSMDATVDVDPEKAAKVTVTFPDTKALTADVESAKYDITIEYEVYKGTELLTSGSATAAKDSPIEITIPASDLESKSKYTVKVVSAKDTFCKDYEAATYKDAKIEFTTTATEFEKAQLAFEERINDAEEILENAVIGVNPFQYLPAKAKKFAEEIAKAKEQLEKITDVIDLFDAIALFDMKVAMFHPILPQVNEKFLIKHKASGLYLNLADGVKISASGTPVQFHRTENNTWYIYSTPKREYVGYEGSNAWTMTNTKNHEFSISAESYNIHYILGKNGYIATDATAEGASVYGDKGKNGNGQWFIEYYETAPLQNLGFDEGNIVSEGICTYGKDMAANGTSLYSAQEVTGWTNASFGAAGDGYENNGFACGAYAWGSTNFLGGKGYTAPATNYEGNTDGAGLGVVATWTTKAQYTQQMELAAGTYTITVPVYNVGGTGEVAKNLIGFVTGDGDEYLATSKKYPVGEWYLEQVTFTLSADTEGVLSVGYEAANAGSGSMPHLFLDYVSVEEGAPSNGSSEEATAVNGISAGATPVAIYSVDGARLQSLQKGMNIVKMSNNQTKKIIVK